mgnify:CR=1 FL=1
MGRQARLKQQRRILQSSSQSPASYRLDTLVEDDAFETEQEFFEVSLPDHPSLSLSFLAGSVPCTPKLFFHHFNATWIRQAVLEYWQVHDFNWSSQRLPNAPTLAGRVPMVDDYLPGDMASVLSLNSFAQHCEAAIPSQSEVRGFCIVVCGLGKAMQLVQEHYPKLKLQSDQLYDTALQITQCNSL